MKRICGMEHEYALEHPEQGDPGDLASIIRNDNSYCFHGRHLNPKGRRHFLNGGQLYLDHAWHGGLPQLLDLTDEFGAGTHGLETCMPECSNARDAALYDQAISSILMKKSTRHGIHIIKNNVDDHNMSYGCHENYFLRREMLQVLAGQEWSEVIQYIGDMIIPFLITRPLIAGSGHIADGQYLLSPRATVIDSIMAAETQRHRPILCTRNRPISATGYRLHLIMGDSNMSEFTNYLKIGTTGIVLDMIESGFLTKKLEVKDPVRALRRINIHGASAKIRTLGSQVNGQRHATSLEIQRWYLDQAREFHALHAEYNDVSGDILDRWEMVIQAMEEDEMALEKHVDRIIKKSIINHYMNHAKVGLGDRQVRKINIVYHLLSPEGLYYKLRDKLDLARLFTDGQIAHGRENSPPDTRAHARARLAREAEKASVTNVIISWGEFRYTQKSEQRFFVLCDPSNTYPNLKL